MFAVLVDHPQGQEALGPGFYDDRHPVFNYSSNWLQFGDVQDYNGTMSRTASNDTLSFDVWGDGFVLYTRNQDNSSTCVDVCINSVCSVISLYSENTIYQATTTFSGLGYGTHNVSIQRDCTGFIIFDALHVLPPAPQPTLPPQEISVQVTLVPQDIELDDPYNTKQLYLVEDGEQTHTMGFDFSLDLGDVLVFIALGMLVALGFREATKL